LHLNILSWLSIRRNKLQRKIMVRVIGLISGTSVDGIDAAFVEINGSELDLQVELIASETYPYPANLRSQILDLCAGAALSLPEIAQLDDAIAEVFAQAAITIQAGQSAATLIGSHGQTVFHRPPQGSTLGYTWQLGRGEVIAQHTGLTTVSNFRVADIAAGGQGAPLVSRVDVCLLSDPNLSRCVQNIGGMGNLTYLPALSDPMDLGVGVTGWDTGPGNVLLDLAVQQFTNGTQSYDANGRWAATGTPCQELVERWLQQEYFHQPPPKSTGRELFGTEYLTACLQDAASHQLEPADILATLTDLTAASIVSSYHQYLPGLPKQVLLCGGGAHNAYLKERLQGRLADTQVLTTDEVGLSADAKEAIAFAVLAYWRQRQIPGNLPTVTGANQAIPLGDMYPASTC
jgi:anhydro-N-acetylmuramic acid kinase